MAGFAVNCDIIDDPAVLMLSAKEFRRAFRAAVKGEQNAFSPFLRRWNCRPPSHEWAELRAAVFARDDYTCGYCSMRGVRLECDHIVPVSRGGQHDMENLITSCKPCNRAKAGKLLSDWVR